MSEEVPETMVGLLWVPDLLELPGIAALNSRGAEGAKGAGGAMTLPWWGGERWM